MESEQNNINSQRACVIIAWTRAVHLPILLDGSNYLISSKVIQILKQCHNKAMSRFILVLA